MNIIADKQEGKDSQTTCKQEIKQKLIILQRVTLWNCSDIFVRQDIFVCRGAAILSFTFRNLMVIARLSQNQFPVSAGLVSLSFEQIMKSGRETSWIRLKWGSGCTEALTQFASILHSHILVTSLLRLERENIPTCPDTTASRIHLWLADRVATSI